MSNRKKECFGILDDVFPLGDKGYREVVPECFKCPDAVLCLKAAISTKEGLEMRAELLDRAASGGLLGRLQRWSRKKALHRLIKQQSEKKRNDSRNNLPSL